MRTAIVDAGTNTLILLIVEFHSSNSVPSYTILHDQCQIVRLGEGLFKSGLFSKEAINRAVSTLSHYQSLADQFRCQQRLMIGTAACRTAQNIDDFKLALKSKKLEFDFRVISGDEEAKLIFNGTMADFLHLPKPILVMDIGGGSTEFIFDTNQGLHRISLPFGVVKLTEEFLHTDPPTQNEINRLCEFLREELKQLDTFLTSKQLNLSSLAGKLHLIATAGTPTTLSALHQNMQNYDATKVHGSNLTSTQIREQMHRLESLPLSDRSQIPCLPEKRADVIIAGVRILDEVLKKFSLNDIHVSDKGLRFGVLADLLKLN